MKKHSAHTARRGASELEGILVLLLSYIGFLGAIVAGVGI